MEAAIAWRIETILATLLIDKLDAWIRRVGLADDIEKLKSEIRRIKIVVSTVREKGIGNELLAEPLAVLQDHLYEADDVVDELDYYRLQDQVQGVTIDDYEGMHGTEDEILRGDTDAPRNTSVGKLRSVVWEYFKITEKDKDGKPVKSACRHCSKELTSRTKNGTSSMRKHLEDEHSMTFTKNPTGAHAPNPSSASEPIVISSSARGKGKKRRSKAWGLVDVIEEENGKPTKARCKYCPTQINCGGSNGTGSIHNHHKICKKKPGPKEQPSNPSSTSDVSASATPTVVGDSSSRKRRRADEDSTQITAANTHTSWDKTIYSNIIQKITSQLQDGRGEVSEVLKLRGSDFASSSNHHQSTGLDQHLRTSSFAPTKVYGRVAEKNSIIKMITEEKSVCVAVLPIVGIAGVGKTVLAQLVYNDLDVKKLFHHRVWVWVSRNFDEVRLTREMLDFIPQERTEVHGESHERISSFAKLQEILASRANSKRILFILDDVWNDMTDGRWENLLKPIKSGCANGSVILVTTRDVSIAKMTGTTEHIKLGALEHEEFRLLFKSHAFGDENYMGDQNLCDIGQKIAEKLKGNPLAAESTGKLLKEKLNADSWNKILKDEVWISVQLIGGIMTALKLSYDQLPYNLQQCFAYCSIFPDGYQFHGGELARIWISQGFVKGNHSSKEMKENYLTRLVNLGFFQEVEREESCPASQTCYAVCGLMHDFARMVALTECGTIDGPQCNDMSQTIRHLSIVTDFEYRKDQLGNILRNEKFENNLRNRIASVTASKLRSLVLLGHYDSFFSQVFQETFQKAHNLRLLHMSARYPGFLKHGCDEVDGVFPQVLSKLYHLQVLDVGSYTDPTIPDGINNLISLRYLVVHKGVCSSVAAIDNMTAFSELHGFKFQISSGFEITQSQTINKIVQDSVHQLYNVKTLKEVYEAVLRKNQLLGKLQLSWKESYADTVMELLPIAESGPSSEPTIDTAREVLVEGFEQCPSVKILEIWYSGAASPSGFDSNKTVISLEALHLYGCGEWQIYPSSEKFPFLKTLKLSNLPKVTEVLVPPLEELVLVQMPKLVRCSSTSVEDLSSSLRALQIENCLVLKVFDLFENDDAFGIEQKSWLPGLRKLILRDCPSLKVLKPLPPSTICSDLLIDRVSILPYMEGSSSEKLRVGHSDELSVLDDKVLAFHNLGKYKSMRIVRCQGSFSLEGFSHLVSLKILELRRCVKLFSSDVMADGTHEDVTAANWKAFPSLETLQIFSCGIAGNWLTLLLRHAPDLEELHLEKIDVLTGLAGDELVHVPLHLISSLKKITIQDCPTLIFSWSEEGFSGFTSLQELHIGERPKLFSSLVHDKDKSDDPENRRLLLPSSLQKFEISKNYSQKTLQPCFPSDLTSLKRLGLWWNLGLKSVNLRSCTALEELTIIACGSLATLEGLQSLGSLRHLAVSRSHGLHPCLESFSKQGYELCSRLETLHISDPSVLTTSFCNNLTSLQRLRLEYLVLTEEQGRALVLLKSLQELQFAECRSLVVLPAGLHLLPSLKRLKIHSCTGISMLLETGLPLSLKELEVYYCNGELADQCRLLAATSKLRVKIDGEWLVL